jgi:MFS family permease
VTQAASLRNLWVIMVTTGVENLGFFMVVALLPFYAERFDGVPFIIGLLVAAFALAQMVTAPVWGRFSDRWGRRPGILLGLCISAVAYLVFAYADSLWLLLLSRLVQGIGAGTVSVTHAYISDTVVPRERALAIGWLTAATSAAAMIGPALGSFSGLLSPAAPGISVAALCILNILFAWRFLSEPPKRPPHHEIETERSVRHSLFEVLRHPGARVSSLIWIYFIGMMANSAMTAVWGLYLERRFGVNEDTIWIFFVYVAGLSIVMRALLLGPLVRRFGEVKLLRAGALALAFGLLLTPLPRQVPALALVILLVPVGTALLFPATTSLVSRSAPPSQVGQILGVQQAFGSVSKIVGPIGAGAAFQYLRIEAPFWMAGTVVLLMGVLTTWLPSPAEEAEELPEAEPPAVEKAG